MRTELNDAVIIFDLDGTLIDTAGDLAAAMNHTLAKAGRPKVDPLTVRHLVGRGARAMLVQGFETSGPAPSSTAELDDHLIVLLDYYRAHIAVQSRPFRGAIDAIRELRSAGAQIAICTNKREAPSRQLIDELRLTDLFDVIVGMDTTSAAKPDPAPVLHCMRLAQRARGVFVGDSDTDIKAAKATGLPCLVATFGYGPVECADQAFAVFSDYGAVPDLARNALKAQRS